MTRNTRNRWCLYFKARVLFVIVLGITEAGSKNSNSNNDNGNNGNDNQEPTVIAEAIPNTGYYTTGGVLTTTTSEQTTTEQVISTEPAVIAEAIPNTGYVTTGGVLYTDITTTAAEQTTAEQVITTETTVATTQIGMAIPFDGFITTTAIPFTENNPTTNAAQTTTQTVVTENTPAPTTQIALVVPTGGFVTTDAEPNTERPITNTEPPTTNTEQTVTEADVTENSPVPTTQIALVVPTGGFVTTDAEPNTETPTTNTEQTVTEAVVTENTPVPTTQIALVVPTVGFVTTDAEPNTETPTTNTEPPTTNTEQIVTEKVVTENTPALVVPNGGFVTTTAKPHTESPGTTVDGTESPKEPVTEAFTTVKMAHDIPGDDFYTTKGTKIRTTVTEENVKEKPEPTSKPLGAIAYKTFKTTDNAKEIFKPTTTPQTLGAIAYTTFMTTDALPTVNLPETNGETLVTGSNTDNTIDTVDGPVLLNQPAEGMITETNYRATPALMIAETKHRTTPALMIAETKHRTTPALMIAETEVVGTEAPNFGLFQLDGSALLTNTSVQGPTSTPGHQTSTSTSASIQSNASGLSAQSGLQIQHLGNLLDTLLNDYDKRIRPRSDQSRRVTIFSDFVTQSIIEFDTQLQSFSVMGYFKMDWRDDFLRWTPSDYGDTKTLRIPAKSVWLPKLLVNKGQDGHGLVGDRNTDIVLINYKGYVRWFPEGIYSVVCQVTIKFYPFDVQNCTFSYYIADEDNSTINLKDYGEVDLTEYIENAEWKLVDLAVDRETIDAVYFINFHYKVERRGGFAMFTLIVPVLMLSMLGGSTFLIPIESGEKCSFSVTIFLSYGIFETMVIDTLPPNSLDVSYFIIYLTSMLIVSTLLTFYTILQAKIFDLVGDRQFGLIRCGKSAGPDMTWGKFLQKLDTYVFMAFLLFVVGCTATFLTVMSAKFDFL